MQPAIYILASKRNGTLYVGVTKHGDTIEVAIFGAVRGELVEP